MTGRNLSYFLCKKYEQSLYKFENTLNSFYFQTNKRFIYPMKHQVVYIWYDFYYQ